MVESEWGIGVEAGSCLPCSPAVKAVEEACSYAADTIRWHGSGEFNFL